MAKRILLIDDDQFIRELYEDIFKEAGYEVQAAPGGEEGLVKAREGGHDLILLDVMMPKLDGLGVLKGLKDNPPRQKNGVILLLTNLAHDPVVKEALTMGAKEVLVKADYNPDQLLEKVKNYL